MIVSRYDRAFLYIHIPRDSERKRKKEEGRGGDITPGRVGFPSQLYEVTIITTVPLPFQFWHSFSVVVASYMYSNGLRFAEVEGLVLVLLHGVAGLLKPGWASGDRA
jgi:hypothetical protein